jgi:hypothetical protein
MSSRAENSPEKSLEPSDKSFVLDGESDHLAFIPACEVRVTQEGFEAGGFRDVVTSRGARAADGTEAFIRTRSHLMNLVLLTQNSI